MRKDTGITRVTLESFLKNVMPEPNTGCWLWMGSLSDSGHGRVFYKHLKIHTAHRASYYFHNRTIPKDKSVLHTCDVAQCVNPDHLYLGTQQDNVKDRDSRNRGKWHNGERNWRATISEQEAKEIKALLKIGQKHRVIAKLFGVSHSLVSSISCGKSWNHI